MKLHQLQMRYVEELSNYFTQISKNVVSTRSARAPELITPFKHSTHHNHHINESLKSMILSAPTSESS